MSMSSRSRSMSSSLSLLSLLLSMTNGQQKEENSLFRGSVEPAQLLFLHLHPRKNLSPKQNLVTGLPLTDNRRQQANYGNNDDDRNNNIDNATHANNANSTRK
eukprot:4529028-Amphidinium_carterae.1